MLYTREVAQAFVQGLVVDAYDVCLLYTSEIKDIKAVYFVGAGGIGMSAIARYFLSKKLVVAGYDKTPVSYTHLCR